MQQLPDPYVSCDQLVIHYNPFRNPLSDFYRRYWLASPPRVAIPQTGVNACDAVLTRAP